MKWWSIKNFLIKYGLEAFWTISTLMPMDYIMHSVQFSSVTQSCLTLWPHGAAHQTSLSIANSWSLHKLMSIESVMPFNHLILCHPSAPAFNLSQYQGPFQWASSSPQLAKVLEFQLQSQSFQRTFWPEFLLEGLVGSPCSPRGSEQSSPTPQLKSINFSALSFL